jgi:gliding motility-associated-like protein
VNSVIEIRDEYTFYAPSAISPDFDDINDVFYVLGNGISTEGFHLYIFDRWGSIIYETENYSSGQPAKSGWDGSFQNGAIVPVGSYTWFVKYFDGDNIRHEKSGVVNVVR